MFKKRTIGLVGAALAGVALIGGTFAAWVITDNADPFGIKIIPGDIAVDDHDRVTLSWGQKTGFTNLSGIAKNTHRLAGSIGLLANTSNEAAYSGKVKMWLVDETENKPQGDPKLLDFLTIDLFDAEVTNSNGVVSNENYTTMTAGEHLLGTITPSTDNHEKEMTVSVSHNTAKYVYAVVSLGNVTASELQKIRNDDVSLMLDWKPIVGQDDVTTKTVYIRSDAGKDAFVYAWNNDSSNAAYPGAAMTELGEGYYSYELSSDYSNLLFVVKEGESEIHKSADLTLVDNKPCYDMTTNPNAWGDAPVIETNLTKDYYLTGSMSNWQKREAYGMTVNQYLNTNYTIEHVSLTAGDEIKVTSRDGSEWYSCESTYDNCGYTLHDGNMVVSATGTYTVNLYKNGDNNNYVTLTIEQ